MLNIPISLNSCTSALELALKAHDIRGEVIVPSMTWNATANSVINTGGKPVFSEINPKTRNITAKLINEKITSQTENNCSFWRAAMFYGRNYKIM